MTTDLAAALLADVPRHTIRPYVDDLPCLLEKDVLAALSCALDPALLERAGEVLEGVTPGRVVQFHPSFCKEAEGAPFSEWDTSHDLSVIQQDGKRYRIGSMRHADDAAFFQWCREGVPALLAQNAALRAERDEPHWDDHCVNQFAKMMREKMALSRAKGRSGWNDPNQCSVEYLRNLLYEHLDKGDPVDVANFCMMLRHYDASTRRDYGNTLDMWKARAEAAEARIATLTARVEGLTGALEFYAEDGWKDRPLDPPTPEEVEVFGDNILDFPMPEIFFDRGERARAALTETATTEERK